MNMSRRTLCASVIALAVGGAAPLAVTAPAAAASTVKATGSVYVRSGAAAASKPLGVLGKGQQVVLAGSRIGKWQPIQFKGRKAYVSSSYLTRASVTSTAAAPVARARNAAMPQGVTGNAQRVAASVVTNFPQVGQMGGYRREAGSDHSTGRAVDIMLPNYRSNVALGNQIANYMRSHASELGISYVIWNQHIWNVQRAGEGWRPMSNRGSDNANHKNHVHVSVR